MRSIDHETGVSRQLAGEKNYKTTRGHGTPCRKTIIYISDICVEKIERDTDDARPQFVTGLDHPSLLTTCHDVQ